LEVFTQRNFVADFFRQKLDFAEKQQNRVFVPPFGDLGVTYTVHLWLVGKRVVDFLLVLTECFSPAFTVEALSADIGRNCGVLKGGGPLCAIFRGRGVVSQRLLASEN